MQRLRCRVMLCDFGLCARLPGHDGGGAGREDEANAAALTEFVGSPGFYAPEVGASAHPDLCLSLTAKRSNGRARLDAARAPP